MWKRYIEKIIIIFEKAEQHHVQLLIVRVCKEDDFCCVQ